VARAPFAALPVPMVTAWLLLGGLLVLPALDVSATGRGVGAGGPAPTRLATLAAALEDADEFARTDFAAIALDEMLEAYADEVNRARAGVRGRPRAQPGALGGRGGGLGGAAPGARRCGGAGRRGAGAGRRGRHGGTVGGGSAGRGRRPAHLGAGWSGGAHLRALLRVSSLRAAPAGSAGSEGGSLSERRGRPPVGERPSPYGTRAASHWSFADREGPSFVTADGLEFRFHDVSRLNEKRLASQALAGELRLLGESLGRLRGQGVAIDTEVVAVRPLAGSEEHHVAVNRGGDYLRLPLPALERAPLVVELARPWLAAAARGEAYQQSFPHAEVLLAELIGPSGRR
jgi:hypothetical protein